MRRIWLSALVAACGFEPGRLATTDAGGGGDDAGDALVLPEGTRWIVDTRAEFGATGHSADGLTIEAPGSLTQIGYTYGGLLMYGKQGQQLWAIATPTIEYAATANVSPDGVSLWGTEYTDTNSNLDRAGVVTNNTFTLWFEGEVFLDANDIVSLSADGAGFVDLLLPTGWSHIESRTDGLKLFPAVAAAGWYQVRAGWGEGTSFGFFDFRRGPSGSADHFSRDRLRAPTSKLQGTMREVFYRQIFGGAETNNGASIAALEKAPLLTATTFTPPPLGAGGDDDWSARWYGQFYAAVAGSYTLRGDTDDGNQVMLAGVMQNDSWARGGSNGSAQSDVTASLAIGWHDVVLDYNQVGGAHTAALVVLAAPEASLVGAAIPTDRLRPVEPRRDRLVSQTRKFSAVNVPNNAAGPNRGIGFVGFTNELVTAIDITIRLNTDNLDQLVFRMTPPAGGTPVVISNHPAGGSFSGFFQIHTTAAGLVGQPLPGTWMLQISDDTGGSNSTSLIEVAVTMHTSGGPGQVATESTWISPVRDAAAAPVHVIDVAWVERAPIASEVFVRSCATADCADNPPWGPAIAQNGTAELTTQYMQSKVVMHSDGTTESVLDTLAITYRN